MIGDTLNKFKVIISQTNLCYRLMGWLRYSNNIWSVVVMLQLMKVREFLSFGLICEAGAEEQVMWQVRASRILLLSAPLIIKWQKTIEKTCQIPAVFLCRESYNQAKMMILEKLFQRQL